MGPKKNGKVPTCCYQPGLLFAIVGDCVSADGVWQSLTCDTWLRLTVKGTLDSRVSVCRNPLITLCSLHIKASALLESFLWMYVY